MAAAAEALRLLRAIGQDPDDYEVSVRDAPLEPTTLLPGRWRVPWRSVFLTPRPGRRRRALRYVGGCGLFWTGDPSTWTEEQRLLVECCCPRRTDSLPVVFETPAGIVVEFAPRDLWSEPLLQDVPSTVIRRRA